MLSRQPSAGDRGWQDVGAAYLERLVRPAVQDEVQDVDACGGGGGGGQLACICVRVRAGRKRVKRGGKGNAPVRATK